MADIDMIPRSYRDQVRVRRTLRLAGIALALVALLGAAGSGVLRWRAGATAARADALQAAATRHQADSARDATQLASYNRLQQDAAVLHALRREGELGALAQGIDAALDGHVWLTALTLERDAQAAATKGDADGAGTEELTTSGTAAQTWHLASTLQLSGQADSYAAVTAFLATLGRQSGIANLRLVGSSAAAEGQAIDFHATGTLVRAKPAP